MIFRLCAQCRFQSVIMAFYFLFFFPCFLSFSFSFFYFPTDLGISCACVLIALAGCWLIFFATPPVQASHHDGNRVGPYCAQWRTLSPHKGNDRITQCEYGKAPTRQLHNNTHSLLSLEWQHKKTSNSVVLSSISKKIGTMSRSPSHEQLLQGCSSPFMRLAEYLTALRAWCKQSLPGW